MEEEKIQEIRKKGKEEIRERIQKRLEAFCQKEVMKNPKCRDWVASAEVAEGDPAAERGERDPGRADCNLTFSPNPHIMFFVRAGGFSCIQRVSIFLIEASQSHSIGMAREEKNLWVWMKYQMKQRRRLPWQEIQRSSFFVWS